MRRSGAVGFSPRQWERTRETYTAWWRGELDRPLVHLVVSDPVPDSPSPYLTNWPADLSDEQIVRNVENQISRQRFYGDALPYFFVNYGPGVAAAFSGASLHPAPDTVWFEPPPHDRLAGLRIGLDRDNPWWRRVCHVTELLARRLGDRIQISITDIGGNMDILAGLRGTERLLTDAVEEPDEVVRCAGRVTRLWLEAYDELHSLTAPHCPGTMPWASTWAPGRTYILQSDFSYMISPDMFRRFVMPDLRACCDSLEYAFYHMDGVGQIPHLDQLLSIPNLHGIQWVPGAGKPPAVEWPDLLGSIRDAGKLIQVSATPDAAREIMRRHGRKGFFFVLHVPDLTDASARRLAGEFGAARSNDGCSPSSR